jgi:flagellar hook-associated protein 2
MGRYTNDTAAGSYEIEEVDATHVRIRKSGDSVWYTSAARDGDVVSFGDGPAKGLSLSVEAGILAGGSATFTFSRGVGELVGLGAEQMTKANTGLLSIRQKSFSEGIKRMDERITRLESSVESFRLRLVKQFSALEQSMSKLKAQNANMTSALGG